MKELRMTAAVPQQTPHRHQNVLLAVAVFCCIAFLSGPASAQSSPLIGAAQPRDHPTGAAAGTANASGQAGVGTTAPATGAKKDDASGIKATGTGSEACSAASLGQTRYNPANGHVEICTP
jgi:hypothetical protein